MNSLTGLVFLISVCNSPIIRADRQVYPRGERMKKTVIITGATDGIGKALAILLSGDYHLALCGRSEEKMKQLFQ